MRDPHDKHRYAINPDTAPIVKRIFEMSASGSGSYTIAKTLTLEKIPTPMEYTKGVYTGVEWRNPNITRMLRNRAYIGCKVANKHTKPSFKSKRVVQNDESQWIVVPNMHEPIVDEKLFELAQRRLPVKKRENTSKRENIFVGLVKCFDCGGSLGLAQRETGVVYFMCQKYRHFTVEKCTLHHIRYEDLYNLVLGGIRENADVVRKNEHRLEDFISESLSGRISKSQKSDRNALKKLTQRREELELIVSRLFEENVLGNMESERFYKMSARYETEIAEVNLRINSLEANLKTEADYETKYRQFVELMRQYIDVEELDANMLNNLIERIDVHQGEGRKPNRIQQVDIHYRLIDEGLTCLEN